MRILWLSNVDLCNSNPSASGTWILSMYNALKEFTTIDICGSITFTNKSEPFMKTKDNSNHYYLPIKHLKHDGTPRIAAMAFVSEVIKKEKPDLIHIWGSEKGWGLMINEHDRSTTPCLLEIQGLSFFVAEERFYGGINEKEVLKMRGLVEILYPNLRIDRTKKRFQRWGEKEIPMIRSYEFINTQSEWVRQLICWIAPKVYTFNTGIILRDSFFSSPLWSSRHIKGSDPIIFTTTSSLPYKGLHVTLRAFSLVAKEYPSAKLRIAGVGLHNSSWKDSGYIRYLRRLCSELGVDKKVVFLGKKDEIGLQSEMYNADVFLISSYVESYCLALAEALCLGMPCIAPYTSALPELIISGENGELYPPGDYYVCAHKVVELIKDNERARKMGNRAASIQRMKSDPNGLASNQAGIYQEIVSSFHRTEVV